MSKNNNTQKSIAVFIGDDESKLYEFIVKGLRMRANQLGVSLLFFTGHKVPGFCSDLVSSAVENNRDG